MNTSASVRSRAPARAVVAIAMATRDPPPDLLTRQVASIRAQTHEGFVCVVCDDASTDASFREIERVCGGDPRFVVHRNAKSLGFYRNFERCVALLPREAEFVALSDQDDVWHPSKLEVLVGSLRSGGALLAYCDMNIVSVDGRVLATSYWTDRRNNYTDLGSLILINTVTGAASLFRRELLDFALPFPRVPGEAYHDHWIACLALSLGEIAFVERPLHDYVQHGANVVGRGAPFPADLRGGLLKAATRFVTNPRMRIRNTVAHSHRYYVDEVVPREQFARTLEERLEGRMAPEKAKIVRRAARLSSSPEGLLWLLARSARDVRGESETLGIENQLIKGIVWHWQDAARRRLRS